MYTNVMEDLFVKKKNDKIINTTIAENVEDVYHVTRQNLYSVHAPFNKHKN